MKKLIIFLALASFLSACDNIGSTKIKNLIDLTEKLEVDHKIPVMITKAVEDPYQMELQKQYAISKHNLIAEPVVAKKVIYSINDHGSVTAFSIK